MTLPGEEEVQLFFAPPETTGAMQTSWIELLSPEERTRADRFHFESDRLLFTAAHALLRTLLGRYLGLRPHAVRLVKKRNGKPELDTPHAHSGLRFNLSHSGQAVLLGFCRGGSIGVDLEHLRPLTAGPRIIEAYFSPAERTYFNSLPADQRERAFYTSWTRKEAYLKARGDGLMRPLDETDILPTGPDSASVVDRAHPGESGGWTIRTVPADLRFEAAFAAKPAPLRLTLHILDALFCSKTEIIM